MISYVPNSMTWNSGIDADDVPEIVGVPTVWPKSDLEFACRGCFLLKNVHQLANKAELLCRDCA